VLTNSKTWHFHILKLTYALLITSHKLSHYFQAHQIEVHTSSLVEILNNREPTGKIAKWAIELSMYDIVYKPRTAIKAKALSDFVVEWMSYPVFMPKPSTHHMHDPGSIVSHIWLKVFTDNQMSRIKYNYYTSTVSKDYDDSQWNRIVENFITPQERQPVQHVA
jgi:hypothetical protein